MAIFRFDFENWRQMSEARSMIKVKYEINQPPNYTPVSFLSTGHPSLRHGQFIIQPWNLRVTDTAELKEILIRQFIGYFNGKCGTKRQ